jgi:GT2 family glycosyltransferase
MASVKLLGVLTMNRHDLLNRLIQSLDYPVDKMVIISQGKLDLNEVELTNPNVKNYIVLESSHNMGVGRGWNYIMKNYDSDYWVIVGDDIYFDKGSLKIVAEYMSYEEGLKNVLVNFMWNDHSSLFTSFIFTKRTIEKVGYFDENIYPAYFEDNDFAYRIVLSGENIATLGDARIFHGDDKHNQACTMEKIQGEQRKKFNMCIEKNRAYMYEKWNSIKTFGMAFDDDGYKTPFNIPLYNYKDYIPHPNYYLNQKILLGHCKKPEIKIIYDK